MPRVPKKQLPPMPKQTRKVAKKNRSKKPSTLGQRPGELSKGYLWSRRDK